MRKRIVASCLALAAFAAAFADDIPVSSTEVEPGVWVGDVVALTNALKTCKAGDTIILAKGTYDLTPLQDDLINSPMNYSTYYGPSMLYIEKADITLKGATGNPEDVMLTATDAVYRLLRIAGARSSVRDIHLTGGYASTVSNTYYNLRNGGAVMFSTSTAFASNCIFSANKSSRLGGAVGIAGNSGFGGVVYDSVFRDNSGTGDGYVASLTELVRCVITNNQTTAAGTQDAGYSQQLTYGCRLRDCLIADNVPTRCGIELGFAENCRFINNYARGANYSNPGGGAARDAALTNCYFYGNRSYRLGGAIRGGQVVNCTVVSNSVINATDSYGGGIYQASLVENCNIISNMCGHGAGIQEGAFVTNCYIAYNWARDGGGGARSSVLVDCVVEHNVTDSYENGNYGGSGGGLYGGSATNCVFRDNSCSATYNSSSIYNCDIFDTSMHAKVFDKCRIANCKNEPIARAIGAVGYPEGHTTSNLYMIGCSVMRNCLITNCNWKSIPGHFVNSAMFHCGAAGTNRIENCTIAGNYHYIFARGFAKANNAGVFANCAIIGNTGSDISTMDDGAVVFSNCVYSTKKWETSRTFLPGFEDGENWQLDSVAQAKFCGDRGSEPYYALKLSSPLRGIGLVLDWMEDDTDLVGNPRLRDGKADIGCFQCWLNPVGAVFSIR